MKKYGDSIIVLTIMNFVFMICTMATALCINPGNGDRDKKEIIRAIDVVNTNLVNHTHERHEQYKAIFKKWSKGYRGL